MNDDQARIVALAESVFGDPEKATRWLNKPKQRFHGQSPAQMMQTRQGLQQIEQLLIAIREGYSF